MNSDQIPNPLNYQTPVRVRIVSKKQLVGFAFALVFLVGLYAFFCIPAYDTQYGIDAVTGSKVETTTWPFGFTTGPTIRVSPLEIRLKKMGVQYKSIWCFYSTTSYSLLGTGLIRGCGTTPPIYSLSGAQAYVVDALTDNQIRNFVGIMQNGTDAQKVAAIADAEEQTSIVRATSAGDDVQPFSSR